MAVKINLLNEPELPPPHEKLLRPPTFFEKYGWFKWFFIVLIVVGMIDFGILKFLKAESDNEMPSPVHMNVAAPSRNAEQHWKTYTSSEGKFSFKYPMNYSIAENPKENNVQISSPELPKGQGFKISIYFKPVGKDTSIQKLIDENPVCPRRPSDKPLTSIINGQQLAQLYQDTACGTSVIYTTNNNILYIMIIQTKAPFSTIKSRTDQIFSTLKFDNQMANEIMCTQEAKQCPDGSWVGRTGPHCEFVCPK